MEALGAGASVVALVTFGLQSAKVIHQVLSSITDGRKNVEQAARDVAALQTTLERLARCRIITERPDEALAARTKACAEELADFAEKLKKLAVGNGPGLERRWRKVKVFLNEKELARMSATVVGHTTGLNLCLKVLESDILFEVKDGLGVVRQDLSANETIRQSQITIIAQQSTIIAQQTAVAETVRDTMTQVTAGTRSLHHETRSMHHAVSASLNGSATQQDQMIQMLNQLVEQVSALSVRQDSGRTTVEEVDDHVDNKPDEGVHPNEDLLGCVTSLLEAIRDKAGIFGLEEADDITDALVFFLQTLAGDPARLGTLAASGSSYSSPPRGWSDRELADLRRNLRTVQGIIMSTRSISVNESGGETRRGGDIIQSRYAMRTLDLAFGTLTFGAGEISWQPRKAAQSQTGVMSTLAPFDEQQGISRETKTQITFIPKRNSTRHVFQAVLHQYHDDGGSYNAIPRLWVNSIRPSDSPLFKIVEEGRLDDFREMLMTGKASLRDHDEAGAPLLFYATQQPDMCRFLLQHGADVDHVTQDPNFGTRRGSPILYVGTALAGMPVHPRRLVLQGRTMQHAIECLKLLLENGCDPMAPMRKVKSGVFPTSYVREVFTTGSLECIRALLDHSPSLINVRVSNYIDGCSPFDPGMTPLLLRCSGDYPATTESLALLLDRGADIRARDGVGRTCLHLPLLSEDLHPVRYRKCSSPDDVRKALRLLIRRGADVYAVDSDGCSASRAICGHAGLASVLVKE
ncbi:ankyrin repeat-containing domain protein [Coniochaeta sp. 2T2.1]|nr:ankyrin repeat-containing domain protein [Coniochaeta sp. 2T2.1]